MKPILVTGASGFIGSKIVELLLDDGKSVVGLDNLNDAYDLELKEWRLRRLESRDGFAFHRIDLADREQLETFWGDQEFTAVINMAARAGVRPSVVDPRPYVESNIVGAMNLLDCMVEGRTPKLVQASTSSLYGVNNELPFHEDADISRPLSPYAATKGAAELLAHSYHHLHGIDVTVLRYFTVYGPAGRPDMSIFRFVQWIAEGRPLILYGDGSQKRDFTYVDDIARGTIAALKPTGFEVINLGGDRPVPMTELIRIVEELLDKPAQVEIRPPQQGDMPATWANIEKAGRLLGWEPSVDLASGLERTVAWYLAERQWAKDIDTSAI